LSAYECNIETKSFWAGGNVFTKYEQCPVKTIANIAFGLLDEWEHT